MVVVIGLIGLQLFVVGPASKRILKSLDERASLDPMEAKKREEDKQDR